ncbi:hypothetical protein AXG93_4905s1120 [Marchantia polymorpha subsp. ruderalis]|uniref:Exocyst subunit Exo70 family protein n=1 Tax=Marchantia polymorpha subsp. ruderalis TaxID=1480154 RepID=A0A176VJ76_MARPO|nr:hypothetical protein AXG93_4905s1120 [Marchantia polymorpha subsp. ruderalis]
MGAAADIEGLMVRTHAFRTAHENIDSTLKAAEVVLTQFDVSRQMEAKINRGPQGDLTGFLAAVDQLQANVEFFSLNRSYKSSDGALNHARGLLQKGMTKIEDEFKALLVQHSKPVDPARVHEALPAALRASTATSPVAADGKRLTPPQSPGSEPTKANLPLQLPVLIAPRIVPQLHEMAQRMIGAAFHQQCLKAYRDVRSSTLEQSLRKLGVEKLSKEDVQKMQWEALEGKIGNWIQYMRAAVKLLFAGERKLCDQVFYHLDPIREKAFAEVTESSMMMLLSFGDAIARSKKSPERLFVLLDMYETMRDLLPEIEFVFSGEQAQPMREAAKNLAKKLAQTATETFNDFEEAVEKDATRTPVLDGTVHPLTSYVINYIKFLLDYQTTLKQLFGEKDNGDKATSKLAAATMRIMLVLQSNLDGKSKLYKDVALTNLFLMNNTHYMVKSVRRSDAKELLGDDWVQRHRRIVQQHAQGYQRAAWAKALSYLSGSSLASSGGSGGLGNSGDASGTGISRAVLKDRFKQFNTIFEELHIRQSQWTIADPELRDAVRLQVAEVLLPAYRSFLKRYSSILENGKNPQKYIKYSPEDLERLLGEFFEGKMRADQRR